MQRSVIRVVALTAPALFCSLPGSLRAEEALSTTAQHLDEAADNDDGVSAAARIGAKFTAFAGSADNATALVTSLHNGTAATLTATAADGTVATTQFQPATGMLGYGNAFIALALAQESLAKAGITQPTPAQIVAALNGGSVTGSGGTATTLTGVLTLRAAGKGWGDIAQTLGVKLGHVVGGLHAANHDMDRPEFRADKIGAKFTVFAGSADNAKALVTGLHDGTTVTLTSTVNGVTTTTEFQPATGKLGYGSAALSLTLAQESLAKAGITQPTPAQLVAALNGGSVTGSSGTATTLTGVLTLRASGDSWRQVAQNLGVPLGRGEHESDAKVSGAAKSLPPVAASTTGNTARSEVHESGWRGQSMTPSPVMLPPHTGRH